MCYSGEYVSSFCPLRAQLSRYNSGVLVLSSQGNNNQTHLN